MRCRTRSTKSPPSVDVMPAEGKVIIESEDPKACAGWDAIDAKAAASSIANQKIGIDNPKNANVVTK